LSGVKKGDIFHFSWLSIGQFFPHLSRKAAMVAGLSQINLAWTPEAAAVNDDTFSFGERVRVLTGKYAGMIGTVIDPSGDSEILPEPRAGYYWIRLIIQNFAIPAHVHGDDIQQIGMLDDPTDKSLAFRD
jgi:hypothetical protein